MWFWRDLYPLAERASELVPVGRGGERRAIALANPGLSGRPYASPGPREDLLRRPYCRSHILEMGRELPEYPTLIAKFANTLLGAHGDIVLPAESEQAAGRAGLDAGGRCGRLEVGHG